MIEKYLYFRKTATIADDDDADGSLMYPVSALRGMVMGTSDVAGAITADEDAFSLFFTPMANTQGLILMYLLLITPLMLKFLRNKKNSTRILILVFTIKKHI